jgi:hypothetical protein
MAGCLADVDFPVTTQNVQTNTRNIRLLVYQLADGSLILNTSNGTCTFLVKLDSSNQVLWSKQILIDPTNTTLPRLHPTADDGFVLAGILDNYYTVVKTDPDGNIQWTQKYSSEAPINYFQSIIQTQDGGYAIAGFGQLVDEGLGWIWFVKTDSAGNMEWNKTISGPLADCPSSVFQTLDGGYVLSDVSYTFDPNHAFFRLIKLDALKRVGIYCLWRRRLLLPTRMQLRHNHERRRVFIGGLFVAKERMGSQDRCGR